MDSRPVNSQNRLSPDGRLRPRIVIIGAGFGGLTAARRLAKRPVDITVVDRRNHHTFQPLLYQVATAGLSPGEIAAPIRWILRAHTNVEVLLEEVLDFDLKQKQVITSDRTLEYDYLIVASGATHAYFGHEEWEPLAPGLKSIENALEIRRRVLLAFELAERQAADGINTPPLQFVVVGAGPTGVELAGTLAEIARHALTKEFRKIDPRKTRILLIEGGPRVLPSYSENLSRKAEEQLRHLGVDVLVSHMVRQIEPGAVLTSDEKNPNAQPERIVAPVIVWAAGVLASPLGGKLGAPVDRAGRVMVEPDLSIPGNPNVFVLGDLATLKDKKGQMLPGVAPVAIQQGDWVAKAIVRDLGHQSRGSFHYFDKGSLATIGRAAAVAQFGKVEISGFFAWLSWLLIHIFFLIGFRNRVIVMIQWAFSYFSYERGARLITGSDELVGWTNASQSGAQSGSTEHGRSDTSRDLFPSQNGDRSSRHGALNENQVAATSRKL
jgi:NADH:ubiquinone reductase (H+-translocating)